MGPQFSGLISIEGPPHLFASNETQGDADDIFKPGSLRVENIEMLETYSANTHEIHYAVQKDLS
jgi:hypothetical protein